MKKTLITVLALSIMVAMFAAVAPAYAAPDAGKGPGNGGNGGGAAGANSTSILSTYMTDATATVLGLDPVYVADQLAAGETFYTIALAQGVAQEDLAGLFASARALATEMAAADGLIIQAQTQLNTATQLYTNTATQSQLNDGTCDGTADCLQTDPATNLYAGTKTVSKGRRGGR